MDWNPSYGRNNGHYTVSNSNYREAVNSCFSPESMASSRTPAETSTDPEVRFSDSHTTKSSCTLSSDRSALTPLSDGSDDIMFSSLDRDNNSRKRMFEDDDRGEHLRFPLAGPFTDNVSSLHDFSAIPYSKLLCAS